MTPFHDLDLRELAEMQSAERAFVSCYLCPPDDTGWLDQRAARLDDVLEDEPEAREHFREGLELVRKWLEEREPSGKSVAVFACFALDFVRGIELPVEVPSRLRLGSGPMIRTLAELQDEYENFVFVALDNTAAHIHLVSSALVRSQERIKGDIKQNVKKGGWSQQRYARRRAKALQAYAGEVAERLEELSREEDCGRIVLLGSEEARVAVLDELSEAAAEKVVGEEPADLDQERDALLKEAYELYWEAEREAERDLWGQIKEEIFSEGLGAAGAEDVWFALANGRADAVAVDREWKARATRCRDCENLTPRPAETCDYCHGEDVFEVSFVEACVRQAELTSCDVDFVDPLPGLKKVGGIAALLRY